MVPEKGAPRFGYALVASAATLWGCWSLFTRTAEQLQPLSPSFESLMVFGVTVLVLGPGAFRDSRGKSRSRKAWATLIALGLADTGNILCYFSALQRTSVAIAVLTHYLAPVLVALAEPWMLKTTQQRSPWPSVGLAVFGLALLAEPWKSGASASLVGACFGLASAFFYAANVLLSKRLQDTFSQREIQAWHVVPGIALLPLFLPRTAPFPNLSPFLLILVGSLLIGVLGGWFFLRGLKSIPASHASVLSLLEPVVAVVVGALVWKEIPGVIGILGAFAILAAAWRVVRGSDSTAT